MEEALKVLKLEKPPRSFEGAHEIWIRVPEKWKDAISIPIYKRQIKLFAVTIEGFAIGHAYKLCISNIINTYNNK